MKSKVLLRIILMLCITAVGVFGFLIVREFVVDGRSRGFYEGVSGSVERRPESEGDSEVVGADESDGSSSGEDDEWVPYVDFEALSVEFPGIVGWIRLEGSVLDYPVMQYSDNDRFLTHLPDGTYHRNGSIFLDYRNSSDFSDKSILIFGHETRSGDMFGILKNYRDQEFYNENPVMYLHSPYADYRLVLFAAHLAHSQRDHPPLYFEDDDEFLMYIDHLKNISLFKSDITVDADDIIVSLCTCAYDFDEARLVVVGVLTEY